MYLARSARNTEVLGFLTAGLIGAAAFFVWAGWKFLDPQNISWLRFGDRAMHTLGWWFFRVTPWGLPLGANPRNGLEISSSVALSDSLPLFAIPFKALSPLLPPVFQYWGLWFLLSMVLQAVFGYAIGRELRLGKIVSLLLAACLVLTPAFLFRLPIHMALAGHWTLLAALYLYVKREPPRRFAWPLLLGVTAAVHGYLLAMVLAIWIAAIVQRLWLKRVTWQQALLEVALGAAAAGVVLWAAGFLMTSSLGADGFGFYRMNLNSFLNPDRWSLLLPDLPSVPGDYEGLSYPGLGVLLLLVLGLVLAAPRLKAVFSPRWLPLLLVVLGLALFAVSDKPVFGTTELGTIPLPGFVLNFASMFRASGRMIWPAGYLVVLLAFVLLDRKLDARWVAGLAAAAVLIQAVDTSHGWRQFSTTQLPPSAQWPTPIKSPFWLLASKHYGKIRAIPVKKLNRSWAELSYFAAFHNMASDATWLGRLDAKDFKSLDKLATATLRRGDFQPDALYVLDPGAAAIARQFAKPQDLLARVDGFILFARNGRALADAAHLDPVPYLPPTPAEADK